MMEHPKQGSAQLLYRWNPILGRWEYWGDTHGHWIPSTSYRGLSADLRLPKRRFGYAECRYVDTWAEPIEEVQ